MPEKVEVVGKVGLGGTSAVLYCVLPLGICPICVQVVSQPEYDFQNSKITILSSMVDWKNCRHLALDNFDPNNMMLVSPFYWVSLEELVHLSPAFS